MTFKLKLAASVLVAGLAVPVLAAENIVIGTGSQGGTYFGYGSGFATMISETLGVNASVEVTGGPVQNVTLVHTGEHNMGFVTMGPAHDAFIGNSPLLPDVEHTDVRALFPMYQTPLQGAVLVSSGITSYSELEGKRVGVGPAGGTSGTYWPRYFAAQNLDVNMSNAGGNDTASQLKDGLIDAFVYAAGLPTGAYTQLSVENDVVFLSMSDAELEAFIAAEPAMSPFTIPANTYDDQPNDLQSVSLWNFAIAHKDMDEETAYQIVKLAMENNDRMMLNHAAAKETLPENAVNNSFMTFHPGAVRWFEENGYEIADNLK